MPRMVRKTTFYNPDEFRVVGTDVRITSDLERTPVQWKAFATVEVTVEVGGQQLVLSDGCLVRHTSEERRRPMATAEMPDDLVTKFPELEAEVRDALDEVGVEWIGGRIADDIVSDQLDRLNNCLANLTERQLQRLRDNLLTVLEILDPPLTGDDA